jgi:predicted CXXCH cytochrome family protein
MRAPRILKSLVALAIVWAGIVPTVRAQVVEHPGSIEKDATCASCHGKKVSGKSVHSAMALPCTVCHVAATLGDMTTFTLLLSKQKLCSACHDEAAALKQHTPTGNKQCLECHDAHSSDQRMLLVEESALVPILRSPKTRR